MAGLRDDEIHEFAGGLLVGVHGAVDQSHPLEHLARRRRRASVRLSAAQERVEVVEFEGAGGVGQGRGPHALVDRDDLLGIQVVPPQHRLEFGDPLAADRVMVEPTEPLEGVAER